MEQVWGVEFKPGTKEESLPNYFDAFPCITSRYDFPAGDCAPWHWHPAVELFYVEGGCMEYVTPSGSRVFPAGSGGLVNANIPHMTRGLSAGADNRQVLHLFDPVLISGSHGSRIEKQYVLPISAAPQAELIPLDPADEGQRWALELLRRSFTLSPEEPGYEVRLRNLLSEVWLILLEAAAPQLADRLHPAKTSEQIRRMLVYIHEHYDRPIPVEELARVACASPRTCFQLFKTCLHTTPVEYITAHRLRMACRMLTRSDAPVTEVAAACGMGSSSYFAAKFRRGMGCTPLEYRKKYRRSGSE